jgi:mRNA interferase MazF
MTVHKNEVYYADLSPVIGSEQGGIRPVLIIQNDIGNKMSPTIIIAAITSRKKKMRMPTHVPIKMAQGKLQKNSIAMLEQIRTIDKARLREYIGNIEPITVQRINRAICISLNITPTT